MEDEVIEEVSSIQLFFLIPYFYLYNLNFLQPQVDVFLSKSISSKLHIFQFPSGFSPFSSDKNKLLNIKAKVGSKRFQMELKIDSKSKNFDRGKSEQIAFVANNDDETPFPNQFMNKVILNSDELKPSMLQYAIGLFKQTGSSKELHLSPINSVIHFRPSFNYFDKSEAKVSNNHNSNNLDEFNETLEENEENYKDEEVKKIIMRFERPDEDKIKKARELSFSFIRQKMINEPWTEINVNFSDSAASLIERQGLLFNQSSEDSVNGYLSKNIFNLNDDEVNVSANSDSSIVSIEDCLKSFLVNEPSTSNCISYLTKIKSLSLSNKVRTIMKSLIQLLLTG